MPSTIAQPKERKGSNFAIWQTWPCSVISPDGNRSRHGGGAPGAGRRSAARPRRGAAAAAPAIDDGVVVWIAVVGVGVGVDGDGVVSRDGEAAGDGVLRVQSGRES